MLFLPVTSQNIAAQFYPLQGMRMASFLRNNKCCQATSLCNSKSLTHLQLTANQSREKIVSEATVLKLENLTEDIRSVSLRISSPQFTFKPGQWLDMFLPSVEIVGGFSISSSPQTFLRDGVVKLAVKKSEHPPANWIHTKCAVGNNVKVRVGGDFYFDPKKEDKITPLILIAGGVGINPISSILQHAVHLNTHHNCAGAKRKVLLLYSAKTRKGLLFLDLFRSLGNEAGSGLTCRFFVTRQPSEPQSDMNFRRIERTDIASALSHCGDAPTVYICGPVPLIQNMEEYLKKESVSIENIHSEKW